MFYHEVGEDLKYDYAKNSVTTKMFTLLVEKDFLLRRKRGELILYASRVQILKEQK